MWLSPLDLTKPKADAAVNVYELTCMKGKTLWAGHGQAVIEGELEQCWSLKHLRPGTNRSMRVGLGGKFSAPTGNDPRRGEKSFALIAVEGG
jgi:hypothetical protein